MLHRSSHEDANKLIHPINAPDKGPYRPRGVNPLWQKKAPLMGALVFKGVVDSLRLVPATTANLIPHIGLAASQLLILGNGGREIGLRLLHH